MTRAARFDAITIACFSHSAGNQIKKKYPPRPSV
jgi:hypothetical protein